MKTKRLSFTVINIFMKNQMQNKSFIILDSINMFIRCFVVFLLYKYVFELSEGSINGTEYQTVVWSMFIYFCIMTFNFRKIVNLMQGDITSGNVEMFMNKPINYLFLCFYKIIGKGLFSFLVISGIGSILMCIFVGLPSTSLYFIPLLFITLILGLVLALIMYSIIGLLAFFMQDVRPIYWITDKMIMILGGSYLPIALFPNFMKVIAYISPFGAINFASSTVYDYSLINYGSLIGIQIIWILAFTAILNILFSKAKENAMVNGG